MVQAEIYVIRNVVNNHVYVGSTVKGKGRSGQHFRKLVNKNHVNSYLQRAWNKYGPETFKVEIVDSCSVEDRWIVEQQWIEKLKAAERGFGYNICFPVRGLVTSERMSKRSKRSWAKADADEKHRRISGVVKAWSDPKHREKMSKVMSASRKNPEFVAKMKASLQDPQAKKKQVVGMKAAWKKPGYKEHMSAAIKEAFTDVRREQYAERVSGYWKDPEYRAKMSQQSKEVWTSKLKNEHSRRMKGHFQDPAYRARHSERMKAWWAARYKSSEDIVRPTAKTRKRLKLLKQ